MIKMVTYRESLLYESLRRGALWPLWMTSPLGNVIIVLTLGLDKLSPPGGSSSEQPLEPKEDQAPAQHLLTKRARPVNGNPMHLVEVVKKHRLVGEL